MKFKNLLIKNFRNFEEINISLTNKNIIFGLNDIGKTNFLSALQFLLDRKYRQNGFIDTDFFCKNILKEIEIILTVDIQDEENDDNKKLYKAMKGAISSNATEIFIKLTSLFNEDCQRGDIKLFWGDNLVSLTEMPCNQSFFELDKYINIIYIDSSIDLDKTFKRYSREIFRPEANFTDEEKNGLSNKIEELNETVNKLAVVKSFQDDLENGYKKFRNEKNFKIKIQSEIEVSNLHNKLNPYILGSNCQTYPTSGDGRRKILSYALMVLENKKFEAEKINIFLVEELENHLHRSMQIALSYEIFSDEIFKYLFMTTHSSLIISQMDNVNLIKLLKTNKEKIIGNSTTYLIPSEYKELKHKLNRNISEAIYADFVLLVEGPSEKILFERILKEKFEMYESFGGYILEVDGINFKEYVKILKALEIDVLIKTDNDLKLVRDEKEINLLGVNRCMELSGRNKFQNIDNSDEVEAYKSNIEKKIECKRSIYHKLPKTVNFLKNSNIFLSKVDLENDLYEAIPKVLDELSTENGSKKIGVDFLQTAKMINMILLCKKLTIKNIDDVYEHENFQCLKKLVELCSQ